MTVRTAAVLLAVALAATLAAGCTSGSSLADSGGTTPGGSIIQTATADGATTQSPDPVTGDPAAVSSGSGGKVDPGIDAQLDAMQKELDALAMPDDKEFDSAEGAIY